jgi:phosphoglucomutase
MEINKLYEQWKSECSGALKEELLAVAGDEKAIEDRFYKHLEFGTGGLRGKLGAGTNRMNVYTVRRATAGLADYLLAEFGAGASCAIAHDSRNGSAEFTREAAATLAAKGVRVYMYSELMPTPMLSFAVRQLKCSGGVVITASHNPAAYNGYKVYGADGCQITNAAADAIYARICECDGPFAGPAADFEAAGADGRVTYIGDDVIKAYDDAVFACSTGVGGDLKIVYTPLNGAGNKPVRRVLARAGFTNVSVVPEQEQPDGDFPTCTYPNPEEAAALSLAVAKAKREGADLVLATDPDSDRVGSAVPDGSGDFTLINGNQMGILLIDYILGRREAAGRMPERPEIVTTIVSTPMAQVVAADHGATVKELLTGFKYIGEEIGRLEAAGEGDRYVFGFEESYGYLPGGYVRDKDAVVASLLICEMTAFYHRQGKSLLDRLAELYEKYGYYRETLKTFVFEGITGKAQMDAIIARLAKEGITLHEGEAPLAKDYSNGIEGLPPSKVLSFTDSKARLTVRPSGTEPKLKVYVSAKADSAEAADAEAQAVLAKMQRFIEA